MMTMKDIYKRIFDEMIEYAVILDERKNVLKINKRFSQYLGISDSEKPDISTIIDDLDFSRENYLTMIKRTDGKQDEVTVRTIKTDGGYLLLILNNADFANIDKTHIDFISTVSHELRTPLTSIKGFADTLLSAGDKLDKHHQARFINIIKSQVDRLTRLVENLLTVSKFESRKNENIYKEISVKHLVQNTFDNLSPKYPKHKFHNNIKSETTIWADSDKMQQVMTNLIDNAAKYSKEGSNVYVASNFSKGNQNLLDICVKDEGIGIPPEYLDKIFTRFSRIDNPLTREVQGTGLGLYITKNLVESMNGKIALQSEGKGSEFIVSLPVFNAEKHTKEKFYQE